MTNWIATLKIKDLLSDNDDQSLAVTTGKGIANRVERFGKLNAVLTDEISFDEIVNNLGNVNTINDWESLCIDDPESCWEELPPITELNNFLNELYDWCDANKVWVE